MIDADEVYDLITPSKSNLIEIAKAVRTDFEGILGYYQVFEQMTVEESLKAVSKDIVEVYKDKEDLWYETYMLFKEVKI